MEKARRRISIALAPAMADRLDAFCMAAGVTRGACITMLLAERLPPLEREWSPNGGRRPEAEAGCPKAAENEGWEDDLDDAGDECGFGQFWPFDVFDD